MEHLGEHHRIVISTENKVRHHLDVPASWRERLSRRIRADVLAASAIDLILARRFRAVTSMLEHPAVLSAPLLVARALAVNLLTRLTG